VLSWKITGLLQNNRYFSIFTNAVRTSTIVIRPVRCLSLRSSNPNYNQLVSANLFSRIKAGITVAADVSTVDEVLRTVVKLVELPGSKHLGETKNK